MYSFTPEWSEAKHMKAKYIAQGHNMSQRWENRDISPLQILHEAGRRTLTAING